MNCMILICPLARYYTTLDKDHSQPIVQSLHILFASKKPGGKKIINIPLLHNQNCHTFLLSHMVMFGLNCGFEGHPGGLEGPNIWGSFRGPVRVFWAT